MYPTPLFLRYEYIVLSITRIPDRYPPVLRICNPFSRICVFLTPFFTHIQKGFNPYSKELLALKRLEDTSHF